MDEIVSGGVKYISTRRASALTGYARDYIGQLVRMGKLEAKRVGRAWYVNESKVVKLSGRAIAGELQSTGGPPRSPQSIGIPSTWTPIKYLEDRSQLLPEISYISDNRESIDLKADSHIVPHEVGESERVRAAPETSAITLKIIRLVRPVLGNSASKSINRVDGILAPQNHVIRSALNADLPSHLGQIVHKEDEDRVHPPSGMVALSKAALVSFLLACALFFFVPLV